MKQIHWNKRFAAVVLVMAMLMTGFATTAQAEGTALEAAQTQLSYLQKMDVAAEWAPDVEAHREGITKMLENVKSLTDAERAKISAEDAGKMTAYFKTLYQLDKKDTAELDALFAKEQPAKEEAASSEAASSEAASSEASSSEAASSEAASSEAASSKAASSAAEPTEKGKSSMTAVLAVLVAAAAVATGVIVSKNAAKKKAEAERKAAEEKRIAELKRKAEEKAKAAAEAKEKAAQKQPAAKQGKKQQAKKPNKSGAGSAAKPDEKAKK